MEIGALRRFSTDILIAAGTAPEEADVVSEILVWCDAVGRSTQGVWRLPILTQRLKKRLFNSPSNIDIQMITNNLGKINANNGLGHFVTYMATQHAIETAKRYGICSITISNSNYHGASGYYSSLIANADLVGIVLSNSFPKVIPYNGQTPALGTNPFSFASPSSIEQEPLLIDMSTSEHAGSTIRKAEESGDKEFGQLYPFGGSKGFGLTLLVEILAGVLSGSGITHQVKRAMFILRY